MTATIALAPAEDPFIEHMKERPVEQERYRILKSTLSKYRYTFKSKRVLDFGCSYGLSACAMIELGADEVVGVEPEEWRVNDGTAIIRQIGYDHRITLHHVSDTRHLDFEADSFDVVLANAVFEHIPQPRTAHFQEVWRVLKPGGHFLLNETPNKYLPADFHTLHLPLTHWLPSGAAHWIGVKTGRFEATRTDWAYSGWRGLGYWEMMSALGKDAEVDHEQTRPRHKFFRSIGLPAALLDPYPSYVIKKKTSKTVAL